MDDEGYWVIVKLKKVKENGIFHKTNNNKGNENICFPFSFLNTSTKHLLISSIHYLILIIASSFLESLRISPTVS